MKLYCFFGGVVQKIWSQNSSALSLQQYSSIFLFLWILYSCSNLFSWGQMFLARKEENCAVKNAKYFTNWRAEKLLTIDYSHFGQFSILKVICSRAQQGSFIYLNLIHLLNKYLEFICFGYWLYQNICHSLVFIFLNVFYLKL